MRKFRDCGFTREKITEQKKEEAFKRIKPETEITLEEANAFWDNFFSQEIEEESV